MSQFYVNNTGGSGPIPPTVPESFITDVFNDTTSGPGTAVPSGNVLSVLGGSTSQANANGIRTDADPNNGSLLYIELTNRATGAVTTTDATPTALITFPLGTTPGTYTFDISVAAFATAGATAPLGAGYTIVGSARTTGAAATLIPTQVVDHFEEGVLGTSPQATSSLTVTGNDVVVSVTGKAAYTIDWVGTLLYIFAS
jgi:hypothetical protein